MVQLDAAHCNSSAQEIELGRSDVEVSLGVYEILPQQTNKQMNKQMNKQTTFILLIFYSTWTLKTLFVSTVCTGLN